MFKLDKIIIYIEISIFINIDKNLRTSYNNHLAYYIGHGHNREAEPQAGYACNEQDGFDEVDLWRIPVDRVESCVM